MKVLSKICQIVALIGAVAALLLFFTNFANVLYDGGKAGLTGAVMAFAGKYEGVSMARSAHLFFCCLMAIGAVLFNALGFKFKGSRVAGFIFGGVGAVYMLVIACSAPTRYFDVRTLAGITSVKFAKLIAVPTVLLVSVALFVCLAGAVANILLDDWILVREGKKSMTIFATVKRFILDYKSEIKKIVWLGPKAIAKNTLVVIIVCLLVGAFVWLVDFGMGKLIELLA